MSPHRTPLNSRKDAANVMKKPKLKKGEKVAYSNSDNILLLASRYKCVVTMLGT
jgi:hypothetical protein